MDEVPGLQGTEWEEFPLDWCTILKLTAEERSQHTKAIIAHIILSRAIFSHQKRTSI
jgi:hypothetical protein